MRRIFALLSSLCFAAAMCAAVDFNPASKSAIPESAFLSAHQYTNAFFGFALSIPTGCHFQVFDQSDSDKPLQHFLFGEKCLQKGLTTFGISATPVVASADDEARKAVLLPTMGVQVSPEKFSLDSRVFWKNSLEEKTLWGQKVWRANYSTVCRGFVLLFWMSTYSSKLAADLRQAFESMKFFEQTEAEQMAGPDSQPYLPEAARVRIQSTSEVNIAELDAGKLEGNLYVNSSLGFSYRFPEGWVHSTPAHLQTKEGSDAAALFSGSDSTTAPDRCVRVLSSFTRSDGRDRVLDFNPRITLLAADPTCFIPDMKFPSSLEEKDAVQNYGEALVHSLEGTRLIGRQKIKLFGIDLNGHIFLEIASNNAETVEGSALMRKFYCDMILATMRNAWIIWLFESDTEEEFSSLLRTAISFDLRPSGGSLP